jgi:hypothetical protein
MESVAGVAAVATLPDESEGKSECESVVGESEGESERKGESERERKGGSEADKPNKKHKPGSSATACLADVGTTLGHGQEAEYEEFIGKKLGGRVRTRASTRASSGSRTSNYE